MSAETILFVVVGLILWIFHSAYRPFARCVVCRGDPKNSSTTGRTWRVCWWCGGKGQRIRWGRRVYERLNKRATKK